MVEIQLTRGRVAIVDDVDAHIAAMGWSVNDRGYVIRRAGKNKFIALHRVIIGAGPGVAVDHVNGDTYDCRRANLRIATQAQNSWNRRPAEHSSRFKGVSWHSNIGAWHVRLQGRHIAYIGDEVEAARRYDREACRVYGEFARYNIPDEHEICRAAGRPLCEPT